MSFLQFLKEFQTLVAGAAGFLGVILTLFVNAWLARRQRDAEARLVREQREDERAHERDTLRAALLAELKIMRDAQQENLRQKETMDAEGSATLVPLYVEEGAYRAFLPKLGLLSEHEVRAVMTGYLGMQGYVARLRLLGSPDARNPDYIEVTSQGIEQVHRLQGELLEELERAIAALEKSDGAEPGSS